MAATPPPGYTPPPADLPQRGDRATFSNRVDAWVTWFSTVILTQLAAIVANAYANALDAAASSTAALGYRDTANTAATAAQTARDLAQTYRDTAQTYRDTALTYRNQAEGFATAAANSAAGVTATSTTSHSLTVGTKIFTVPAGKQFPVNLPTVAGASGGALYGKVVSYSGTDLELLITKAEGTGGPYTSWAIGPSGATGATGGTAGGTLTGALEFKKGTDVVSASNINPWNTGGNFMDLTGGATINTIDAAPQAGSTRTLYVTGTPTIVNSANVVVKGGSATLLPGDELDFEARSTTQILVTVRRGAGISSAVFTHQKVIRASGAFIPQVTGLHKITLIGASGSGGVAGTPAGSCTTGAGAGGVCIDVRQLTAGVPYSYVAGSGAADVTYSGTPTNGATAGNATFTVSGYATMTANGGQGGNAAAVGPVLGGLGGTATGGAINITGGRGGNITGSTATGLYATGGGAVGYQGKAYNGGDIVTGGSLATASGGAAGGGKGGDAAQGGRGGGAGTGGPGGDALTNVNGAAGVNLDSDVNSFGLSVPSVAQYASGWLGASGAGAPGISGSAPVVPAFGGASAGHVGSDAARQTKGFSAMGGTAAFAVTGTRLLQGVGGASGGYTGATAGNPTGGATEGSLMLVEWNVV